MAYAVHKTYAVRTTRGCVIGDHPVFAESDFCDRVDMPAMFGAKGIARAEERVSLVVGDVMQPFPETVQQAAVDTLVMKHFLSAFNDKDATLILKHCSQVLAPQGKILLLQVLTDTGPDTGPMLAQLVVLHTGRVSSPTISLRCQLQSFL